MAPFLLFAFIFASQIISGFSTPLPPPFYGKNINILSIDGGGIRGIIPATVLEHLDKALKARDPTASLAHYFDVIAGTSTGGLMAAMLAAPNSSEANTPLFNPSQIVEFYKTKAHEIFSHKFPIPFFPYCPKYDGKSLQEIVRKLLKDTRLSQTLTNLTIPAFDRKKLKPVIFSNIKLKREKYLNAKLSDICLGTSAAPTYFPDHKFENDGHYFDLVDGALASNNPALIAVSEVMQHSKDKRIRLLSLGTGSTNDNQQEMVSGFIDDLSTKGCKLRWLASDEAVFSEAMYSTEMTHYYLASVFPGLIPADNYLRIEKYNLDKDMELMDKVDDANLNKLEGVGKKLLNEKVKRMDTESFTPVEMKQTNAEALERFAEYLYEERQLRLRMKAMENGEKLIMETVEVISEPWE